MPLLTLTIWPALDDAGLQLAVARELSNHTERLLGKQRSLTAVRIQAAPDAWFIGGEPLPGVRTFALDIRITAGTNTEVEKSAWIAAAWDSLAKAIPGAVAPASYISIHEIEAGSWGYTGRTQAARRQEAVMA
ncbi:MAG: 4-oxalocrotonate tautomerase family protein [Leptothrix sp. (in: b-proteobacteria)]